MQISKQLLLYTSITILLSSCAIHKYEFPPEIPEWCDDCGFCSGDLIFVRGINTEGMSAAISSATGEYTHVAIVECPSKRQVYEDQSIVPPRPKNIFVIESLPGKGVVRRPLEEFFDDIYQQMPDTTFSVLSFLTYMTLNINLDIPKVMERLHNLIGLPYDNEFMPDNNKYYCSELVYETYLDEDENPIFDLVPMNFKDQSGKVIPYWQEYFDSLSILVPQNVSGTNPTQLSQSQFLLEFKIQ
ncbi:MAG: hypothetical protein MJZ77_01710 [Bacteroidales bacterium]|nr:hypothetical protein [Bacteroidales bacterium]